MGFLMIILLFVIRFWDLLLCPPLLLLVPPFCVYQVNPTLIYLIQLTTLPFWYLNGMIALVLGSQGKGAISVTTGAYKGTCQFCGQERHKCDHLRGPVNFVAKLGHKIDRFQNLITNRRIIIRQPM